MGGANSRASAEETVVAMIEKLHEDLATACNGSTRNVLEFTMSSIQSMDDAVMKFVSECNNTILQDNWHVLNAYYDATQKARNAALHVKQHASISMVELERLQIAFDNANKMTERSCYLALKGLDDVDDKKIVFPDSLVTMLQEAQNAYANVITICDHAVEKRVKVGHWIWKVAGACAVIVLGVTISALASPITLSISCSHTSSIKEVEKLFLFLGATALGVGVAGAVVGNALSIPLTLRIQELNQFARTIKEQQALLEKAKMDTERVIELQIDLKKEAKDVSMAKEYENMRMITEETFVASLEKHLQELKSLCETCDELCATVNKAFEYFKEKKGLIRQRICHGMSLDESE